MVRSMYMFRFHISQIVKNWNKMRISLTMLLILKLFSSLDTLYLLPQTSFKRYTNNK